MNGLKLNAQPGPPDGSTQTSSGAQLGEWPRQVEARARARALHPRARRARRRAEVKAAARLHVGVLRVGAIAEVDRVAMEVVGDQHRVEAVLGEVAPAGDDVGADLVAVAPLGHAVARRHFGALEIAAQDDVDHAGDRVGAVDRRGAVGQHLDALDRAERDRVQVDEREVDVLREAVVGDAPAVDQHQRRVLAEVAQADAGGARREAVGELVVEREAALLRQRAQHFRHRGLAALLDVLAREHGDGCGAFGVDPLDVRAGDLDPDVLRRCRCDCEPARDAERARDPDGYLAPLECHAGIPQKRK